MKVLKTVKGFTLQELMAVVFILALLSAIAIPKFANMIEKAKEGATKGNIGQIMAALSVYYGDQAGYWPLQLTDSNFQNYLAQIPAVKITHPHNMFPSGSTLSGTCNTIATVNLGSGGETYNTSGDGWLYNQATGNVFVNNSQTDSSGVLYSTYGYK